MQETKRFKEKMQRSMRIITSCIQDKKYWYSKQTSTGCVLAAVLLRSITGHSGAADGMREVLGDGLVLPSDASLTGCFARHAA
ncbi:MAG: hypothetical protein FWD31_10990, partial [Planctomycetaceae bacterium]|nr:hypothetical protein [Planctomycetaceae bacterium]